MILTLDLTEKEKSSLLLHFAVENNILLKNIQYNLTSIQADLDDVRHESISGKYDIEKLNDLRQSNIAQFAALDEQHCNGLRQNIETYVKEVINILRGESVD